VQAGERLTLGRCRAGCRGYLAIAGGVDGASVLGSRSTYLRAGLGGIDGRALREGDVLTGRAWTYPPSHGHWKIDPMVLPAYSPSPTLRVLRGLQAGEFGDKWLGVEFKVTPQSDRMGIRLDGQTLLRRSERELLSAAVTPGTVQVPPDGRPILLLADAQTIGGYPRLAQVIGVDLPLEACTRPEPVVLRKARRPESDGTEFLPRTPTLGSLAAQLPILAAEQLAELSVAAADSAKETCDEDPCSTIQHHLSGTVFGAPWGGR